MNQRISSVREKISTLLKESIKTCSEKALLANLRDFHGPIELDITETHLSEITLRMWQWPWRPL